jgi:hypothetical protein
MDKKYVIYKNDLKNREMTKIDVDKIDWSQNDIRHLYNVNHDTLEYRLQDANNENNNNIDLTNLKLLIIPNQIKNNMYYNNLKHLFISNNNLSGLIDISSFIKLETLDIDYNDISDIKLSDNIGELSICNNKLKYIKCNNNLLRLKCSHNIIEKIDFNNKIEIIVADYNKLNDLNMSSLNNCSKLIIFNNPLNNLIIGKKIRYIDISETLIAKLNDCDILQHLVANKCINLKYIPKYKNIEYLEIIGTPIEKLYYYDTYKLILLQFNLTKNISKKYKESNANIQIRNNILLAITKYHNEII